MTRSRLSLWRRLVGLVLLTGLGFASVEVVWVRELGESDVPAFAHAASTAMDADIAEEVRSQGRSATRVVESTFMVLAVYIAFRAGSALWRQAPPDESTVGLVLAAASLLIMPLLAWRKLRGGRELDNPSLVADSKETFVCAYMLRALLVGLGLHAWLDR